MGGNGRQDVTCNRAKRRRTELDDSDAEGLFGRPLGDGLRAMERVAERHDCSMTDQLRRACNLMEVNLGVAWRDCTEHVPPHPERRVVNVVHTLRELRGAGAPFVPAGHERETREQETTRKKRDAKDRMTRVCRESLTVVSGIRHASFRTDSPLRIQSAHTRHHELKECVQHAFGTLWCRERENKSKRERARAESREQSNKQTFPLNLE